MMFEQLYEICTETQSSVLETDNTRKILDLCEKLQKEIELYEQNNS